MTVLNWLKSDYFAQLLNPNNTAHTALEKLVDDLHADKQRTIQQFVCHAGSEDFLWALIHLLGNHNARVAGNAAYIIGTIAESDIGCYRILRLTQQSRNKPDGRNILEDLTTMLTFDDAESVMNAAGTIGTLAETPEGREMLINETCLSKTIENINVLLNNQNVWTSSNAALVLARLTICEAGCLRILNHESSDNVLIKLIQSLGVDEAGRGMNAAFAIGRLCDMDVGRSKFLSLSESERMISSLAVMLSSCDNGSSKNACFAVSCLATTAEGHSMLMNNGYSDDIISTLCSLLMSEDSETAWFSAMTLRTYASQPRGCLRLRDDDNVITSLKKMLLYSSLNSDLKEEIELTLEILKKLSKPSTPNVEVKGPTTVDINWDTVVTKSGLSVTYQLYEGSHCEVVWCGSATEHTFTNLQPYTSYTYRLRTHTPGDDSPFSDPITITTEESVPGEVANLHVAGFTTTQLKVMWEPPNSFNGVSKGYNVYKGNAHYEHTYEHSSIVSGLQPNTAFEIQVCACTSKGKGPRSAVVGMTADTGAHAPSKPNVSVLGRHEVHVSWETPFNPLGKINRYDLAINGKVVYSGTDLAFSVRRLSPDTEYAFTVSAITNEGKCESKPTKKRTSKDEYEGIRQPLYISPKRDEPNEDGVRRPSPTFRRRRSSTSQETVKQALRRINSAHSVKNRPTFVNQAESDGKSVNQKIDSVAGRMTPLQKQQLLRSHESESQSQRPKSRSKSGKITAATATQLVPVESPDGAYDNLTVHISKNTAIQSRNSVPLKVRVAKREKDTATTVVSGNQEGTIITQLPNHNLAANSSESHFNITRTSPLEADIKTQQSSETDVPNRSDSSNATIIFNNNKYPVDQREVANLLGNGRGESEVYPNAGHDLSNVDQPRNNLLMQSEKTIKEQLSKYKPVHPTGIVSHKTFVRGPTSVSLKETPSLPPRIGYTHKQHPRRMSDSLQFQPVKPSLTASRQRSRLLKNNRELSMLRTGRDTLDHSDTKSSQNWLFQADKSHEFELTRSFTTIKIKRSRTPKFTNSVSSVYPTAVSLENQLNRTNTFVSTHRPIRRTNVDPYQGRNYRQLSAGVLNSLPNQWKPDFPNQQIFTNASKFVPMQYRTQPANLPCASTKNQENDLERELSIIPLQSSAQQTDRPASLYKQPSRSSYGAHKATSSAVPARRMLYSSRISENVPS